MGKRASPRLVKINRTYTLTEASKLLGVNKRTISAWINEKGLEAIQDKRPFLIIGANLKSFLEKQRTPKLKCLPHQCYCFSCRSPRDPAFDELEYHALNKSNGRLVALCCECSTTMHKGVSQATLNAIGKQYTVRTIKADERLSDT